MLGVDTRGRRLLDPSVGDGGDPDSVAPPVRKEPAQRRQGHPPRRPVEPISHRHGVDIGTYVEERVVAEPAELVVVGGPLEQHLHRGDAGQLLAQAGEERRVEQQFLLLGQPAPAPGDGRTKRAQQGQASHVAQHHCAAVAHPGHGLGEHRAEVVHPGEGLHHRVEDDDVERPGREAGEVGGLPVQEGDVAHAGVAQPIVEGGQGGGGQIGGDVGLAVGGHPPQEQPRAAAQLEHPHRTEVQDAGHGGVDRLGHLAGGDRLAGVAAHPPGRVEGRIDDRGPGLRAALGLVVHRSPFGDLGGGQRRPVDFSGRGYHVGDEADLARPVLPGHHHSRAYGGMGFQGGLDLAALDAVAPDLDLVIEAAEELHLTVGPPPGQVTGLVQPGPGAGVERVGDEALGGQFGPTEVAAGQACASDVQLAGDAHPHGLQPGVEDIEAGVGQRAADGERMAAGRHLQGGRPDRRLRRPVEVPQGQPPVEERVGENHRKRLTATQGGEPWTTVPTGLDQQAPGGRRGLQHCRPGVVEQAHQPPRI